MQEGKNKIIDLIEQEIDQLVQAQYMSKTIKLALDTNHNDKLSLEEVEHLMLCMEKRLEKVLINLWDIAGKIEEENFNA